jgi:hypothetical protein
MRWNEVGAGRQAARLVNCCAQYRQQLAMSIVCRGALLARGRSGRSGLAIPARKKEKVLIKVLTPHPIWLRSNMLFPTNCFTSGVPTPRSA